MASKYYVAAVEKAIQILNYISSHQNCTFTEIFTNLKLSKSTTYQTLFTLEAYQYVIRTKDRKYQLGVGVLPLIRGVSQPTDIVELSRDSLTELANKTELTVHLCAFTQSFRAVCLFKIDGINFTIRNTAVGRELCLHTSAAGKVLLAWLPPDELPPYLANVTYKRFTDTTITSPAVFRQELLETKSRGYSIDNCEGAQGAMGIGVPILNHSGRAIAAISIGAVITEIPLDQYDAMAQQLRDVAAEITAKLPPDF